MIMMTGQNDQTNEDTGKHRTGEPHLAILVIKYHILKVNRRKNTSATSKTNDEGPYYSYNKQQPLVQMYSQMPPCEEAKNNDQNSGCHLMTVFEGWIWQSAC